jgi:hypothetical protein
MLVTFSCDVYSDTTYFGDIAQSLLKMMGQSGNVPAILAEDVPMALACLQSAVETCKAATVPKASMEGVAELDDWKEKPMTLAHRRPLIELLNAAAKANRNVMWDRNLSN